MTLAIRPPAPPRLTLARLAEDIEEPLERVKRAAARAEIRGWLVTQHKAERIIDALLAMAREPDPGPGPARLERGRKLAPADAALVDGLIRADPSARPSVVVCRALAAGVAVGESSVGDRRRRLGLGPAPRPLSETIPRLRLAEDRRRVAAARRDRHAPKPGPAPAPAPAAEPEPEPAPDPDLAAMRANFAPSWGPGRTWWLIRPGEPAEPAAARLVARGLIRHGDRLGDLDIYRITGAGSAAITRKGRPPGRRRAALEFLDDLEDLEPRGEMTDG